MAEELREFEVYAKEKVLVKTVYRVKAKNAEEAEKLCRERKVQHENLTLMWHKEWR